MGMVVRHSGRITITPPITDIDWFVQEGYINTTGAPIHSDVRPVVEEQLVPDVPGAYRRVVIALESNADGFSGYNELDDLRRMIWPYINDHQFTGAIECVTGEDGGDHWRLTVINGVARRITARVIWPGEDCPCGRGTVPA